MNETSSTFISISRWAWKLKYIVLIGAIAGFATAWFWADSSRKIYVAEGVYTTQSQQGAGGLAGLMTQLTGLSSLSALGMASDSSSVSALATLHGPNFTARFIHDAGIEPKLFPDLWDATSNQWKGRVPTDLELIKAFDGSGMRTIVEDRRTGLVTIRIQWSDGAEAVKLLTTMVDTINQEMRDRALTESRRSVQLLEAELAKRQELDLRQTINTLIATNLKQVVLAEVRRDFAFREVSAPVKPQARDYIWPRRMLMCLLGVMIGTVIASLLGSIALTLFPKRN